MPEDFITLTGLRIPCVIGIFDWERKRKQDVVLDLRFPTDARRAAARDRIEDAVDYKKIAKASIAFVSESRFQLVETLAERLADHLLSRFKVPEVFLRVSKPGAVRGSQNVGVEITRKRSPEPGGLAFFSLGSNIQPKLHLENALREIGKRFGLKAVSHVYETSPVGGKKGQPFFWNMVVGVDASEEPGAIRRWIGKLEKKEGRRRTKDRYGSRTLDVDLILWKDWVADSKAFTLPHPDIQTKAFVLFPLLEIAPTLSLPGIERPLIELAHSFKDKSQSLRRLDPSPLRLEEES